MNESALPAEVSGDAAHPITLAWSDDAVMVSIGMEFDYETIRDALRETFVDEDYASELLASFGTDTSGWMSVWLDYGDRAIKPFDLRRIIGVLKDEFGVNVTGLRCPQGSINQFAERELKLRLVIPSEEPAAEAPELVVAEAAEADGAKEEGPGVAPAIECLDEDDTEVPPVLETAVAAGTDQAAAGDSPDGQEPPFVALRESENVDAEDVTIDEEEQRKILPVDRSLRSGDLVRSPGDIIVFGDVNAGAQLEAVGNIVVMGALRGMAHAGKDGDEQATIVALEMRPAQLRIADQIGGTVLRLEKEPPRGLATILGRGRETTRTWVPEVARLSDGQIIVEDYRGRNFH